MVIIFDVSLLRSYKNYIYKTEIYQNYIYKTKMSGYIKYRSQTIGLDLRHRFTFILMNEMSVFGQ